MIRIELAAIVAVIAFGSGMLAQHELESGRAAKSQVKAAAVQLRGAQGVLASQAAQTKATEVVAATTETARAKVRARTTQLAREATAYVSPQADRQCAVPNGFVRLHDNAAAAASAVLPPAAAAAGQPDDAPSGVALSGAGGVVAENYGRCGDIRETLIGLQAWARQISGGGQ